MTFNYLARRPCSWIPTEKEDIMPQVAAGVVGGAELYSQPAADTRWSNALAQPGTWSYIWVGAALLYLVGIYIGAIRIAGRSAA